MIKILAGDTKFQKELSQMEKVYISEGDNWIGKSYREVKLKALHKAGYKLDDLQDLPKEEQEEIWSQAISAWNGESR